MSLRITDLLQTVCLMYMPLLRNMVAGPAHGRPAQLSSKHQTTGRWQYQLISDRGSLAWCQSHPRVTPRLWQPALL